MKRLLLRVFVAPGTMAFCALQAGCGSNGNSGFRGNVGTYEPDASFSSGRGDASGPGALDAYIEQGRVQVKFITVSCSGACATVEAVGTGGQPSRTPGGPRWTRLGQRDSRVTGTAARRTVAGMLTILEAVAGALFAALKPRASLVAENLDGGRAVLPGVDFDDVKQIANGAQARQALVGDRAEA
jgi:hypothetical protein